MERIPTDETLIIDGILRRDDSDRIGALTRRVQAFQEAQGALHATLVDMLMRVQDAVAVAFSMVQQDMATALDDAQTQLAALNGQAVELAADLELLLTTTGAAQVTQADLDLLDSRVHGITAAAEDVLERTQDLGDEQ